MNPKEPFITGTANIKSNLTIEQIGEILSDKIFSGIPFEGKDLNIYDEVPAIFIKNDFLGFNIILQGYPLSESENGYWLEIIQNFKIAKAEYSEVSIDNYLKALLVEKLKGIEHIDLT